MATVKKIGNDFEQDFAQTLSLNGFWAMRIPDDNQGQPFDIIAAKNGVSYAFECKTCQNGRFNPRRIEVNQRYAFTSYIEKGNKEAYFVFLYNLDIYMAKAEEILTAKKTIDVTELTKGDEWI